MRNSTLRATVIALFAAAPGTAQQQRGQTVEPVQEVEPPQSSPQATAPSRPGQTAESAVGQTGRRQAKEASTSRDSINSLSRVNARIQNRVQSRIRNRIDQYYDARANAKSPFEVASGQ